MSETEGVDTSPTNPAHPVTPNTSSFTAPAPASRPARRRQFRPGQRIVDSFKRQYWVDQNGSLRRVQGAKPTKAEKKAAKRQRRQARRVDANG